MFTEIANDPNQSSKAAGGGKSSSSKSSRESSARKSITSTCLKNEHLEAAQMLLKAGLACDLKPNGEEECENTAIALERVVADLIGLTSAVANALNNALKGDYDNDADVDWALIQKWCEFYSDELLVETRALMKKTTPTLDAYGLFLPSRIGVSVPQDLLQKGLKGRGLESEEDVENTQDEVCTEDGLGGQESIDLTEADSEEEDARNKKENEEKQVVQEDNGYDEYDEYEYEEYDYEE